MFVTISKRNLAILTAAVGLGAGFGIWWLQPDRSLARAWDGLIDAIESRRPSGIHSWLAPDYHDRWGYDRETLTEDARLAFFHFRDLELLVQGVTVSREGDDATITAIIRLKAIGSERAGDARLSVNSLYTPFTFQWERNSAFPWSWRLKSFNHPELDLARFRQGSFLPY